MKKVKNKYYNKQITTRDNGNNQSREQKERKLNSIFNQNNATHTLKHEKTLKSPFSKNNVHLHMKK